MNWRWYFIGITIALAFLGISLEQSAVPNQEIVVQFNADFISSDEAKQAISEITNQLKAIGVADVQISELREGRLKVTYYSTIEVAVIKNLFYKQKGFPLESTAFTEKESSSKIPFHRNSNSYELDVIEIQKDFDSDFGLHGLPVEVKSLRDQYLNQIVFLDASGINFSLKHCIVKVGCEIYHETVLLTDTTSHKIPEVRAGPLS